MIRKAGWAAARLGFLGIALAGAVSGGLAAWLLGPLYTWCFFGDVRFLRYRRVFAPLAACCWGLLLGWLRSPAYREMFSIPLTAPPLMGPDTGRVGIRADWTASDGSCTGCVQCCSRRSCPMLDAESGRCSSYGSFFWRYFNCGRYPETLPQIRFYDCPKWELRG